MNQNNFKIIDGKTLPRVTHILNIISKGVAYENWLKKNSKEESEKISETALDIGSGWHNILERVGQGEVILPDTLQGLEKDWLTHFLAWKDLNVKCFLETETPVWTNSYCGTLDALVFFKDHRIALLDYKTSAAVYSPYYLQCAAYRDAYMLRHKIPIDTCFILRFDKKTGEMEAKEVPELEHQSDIFQKAFDLWQWNKNKGE